MSRIEQQFGYDAWLYDSLNPDENIFLGRYSPKKPKDKPGWMLKAEARQEMEEREREEREDDFLRQHGITLKQR